MREWFLQLWEDRCRCDLRTGGYVIGWLGAIYRTVAIGALSIRIAELPDDERFCITLYTVLLTYSFISLAAEFLLIVGLSKKKPSYLVPYLGIHGTEILLGMVGLILGIIIIIGKGESILLSYVVPCVMITIGAYMYFWLCLLRLFQKFKSAADDTSSIKSQENNCRSIRCSCCSFKSDSLDIVTVTHSFRS